MTEGRRTWPGPMSVAGVGPGHEHDLPAALLARVRMLTRSLVIFGVCLVSIGTCLVLILLDRSNVRDAQNERTNQRINESLCDLLDQLPEGGLLQRPRDKYGCGPGIPLDQLTPQEQAQLGGRTQPQFVPPTSSAVVPAPPLGSSATDVPPPPATTLPPRTGPGPESSPAPDPLGPITDPLCDLADVCL